MTDGSEYEASLAYLEALYHRPMLPARRVGLQRVGYLLGRLGDPQKAFRSVHVAGSTGKGSTTAMVGEILMEAGFHTGVFTSPHLHSVRERISVNRHIIARGAWGSHWSRVFPIVRDMTEGAAPNYSLGRPTYFEVLFTLMALHFASAGVQWAAIETGLGGRLDATNTLTSDVAVVTNISLEHTQVLGTTVGAIAGEKAAIIKPGCHAVTAAEHPDALSVITARSEEVEAPLLKVPDDVRVDSLTDTLAGQTILLHETVGCPLQVRLSLPGQFQRINAATAYAAAISLRQRGIDVSQDAVKRGLEHSRVPGRLEVVTWEPLIIVDGAHSPAAAHQLCIAIDSLLQGRRVVLLFAAMDDKDIDSMAAELGPRATEVVVTRVPGSDRTAEPQTLRAIFGKYTEKIVVEEDSKAALTGLLQRVTDDTALVVCGSMYLVGQAREFLRVNGSGS